jgi:GNAT superfamily N-acetyltransferase
MLKFLDESDILDILKLEFSVLRSSGRSNTFSIENSDSIKEKIAKGAIILGYCSEDGELLAYGVMVPVSSDGGVLAKDCFVDIGEFNLTMYISSVVVKPNSWGKGLQKRLMFALEDIAKGLDCYIVCCKVADNNDAGFKNVKDLGYDLQRQFLENEVVFFAFRKDLIQD